MDEGTVVDLAAALGALIIKIVPMVILTRHCSKLVCFRDESVLWVGWHPSTLTAHPPLAALSPCIVRSMRRCQPGVLPHGLKHLLVVHQVLQLS